MTPPVSGRVHGIDVSHYQGGITWAHVRAAGYQFCFLKASEALGRDDHFATNREGARAAGIAAGAYHFFHYDVDWGQQASGFCATVGKLQPGELPPVLDLEQQSYRDGKLGIDLADAHAKALSWLTAVHNRLGVCPIVYCDRDFARRFLQDSRFAQYPLWLAAYTLTAPPAPAPWSRVAFWQHSERGIVPGVYSNGTDLDWFMGDAAALGALRVAAPAPA